MGFLLNEMTLMCQLLIKLEPQGEHKKLLIENTS